MKSEAAMAESFMDGLIFSTLVEGGGIGRPYPAFLPFAPAPPGAATEPAAPTPQDTAAEDLWRARIAEADVMKNKIKLVVNNSNAWAPARAMSAVCDLSPLQVQTPDGVVGILTDIVTEWDTAVVGVYTAAVDNEISGWRMIEKGTADNLDEEEDEDKGEHRLVTLELDAQNTGGVKDFDRKAFIDHSFVLTFDFMKNDSMGTGVRRSNEKGTRTVFVKAHGESTGAFELFVPSDMTDDSPALQRALFVCANICYIQEEKVKGLMVAAPGGSVAVDGNPLALTYITVGGESRDGSSVGGGGAHWVEEPIRMPLPGIFVRRLATDDMQLDTWFGRTLVALKGMEWWQTVIFRFPTLLPKLECLTARYSELMMAEQPADYTQ
jgi:hypothetical protein